jgi:hypothetical protein
MLARVQDAQSESADRQGVPSVLARHARSMHALIVEAHGTGDVDA